MVESDAKAYIKALKPPINAIPWRISTIPTDSLFWAFRGQHFVFWWCSRESNKATHVLVSWCLRQNLPSCFVQGSAPSPFLDVIYSNQIHVVFAT